MDKLAREAFDLLREALDAWEGEEGSVREEHADLINRMRRFVELIGEQANESNDA